MDSRTSDASDVDEEGAVKDFKVTHATVEDLALELFDGAAGESATSSERLPRRVKKQPSHSAGTCTVYAQDEQITKPSEPSQRGSKASFISSTNGEIDGHSHSDIPIALPQSDTIHPSSYHSVQSRQQNLLGSSHQSSDGIPLIMSIYHRTLPNLRLGIIPIVETLRQGLDDEAMITYLQKGEISVQTASKEEDLWQEWIMLLDAAPELLHRAPAWMRSRYYQLSRNQILNAPSLRQELGGRSDLTTATHSVSWSDYVRFYRDTVLNAGGLPISRVTAECLNDGHTVTHWFQGTSPRDLTELHISASRTTPQIATSANSGSPLLNKVLPKRLLTWADAPRTSLTPKTTKGDLQLRQLSTIQPLLGQITSASTTSAVDEREKKPSKARGLRMGSKLPMEPPEKPRQRPSQHGGVRIAKCRYSKAHLAYVQEYHPNEVLPMRAINGPEHELESNCTPAQVDITRCDMPISLEEIMTYFPVHTKWYTVAARYYYHGWTARSIRDYVYWSRELKGGLAFERTRIHQQLRRAVDYYEQNPGILDRKIIPAVLSQIHKAKAILHPSWDHDYYLADLAEGVKHHPEGPGRQALTHAIEHAGKNGHKVLLSEARDYVVKNKLFDISSEYNCAAEDHATLERVWLKGDTYFKGKRQQQNVNDNSNVQSGVEDWAESDNGDD